VAADAGRFVRLCDGYGPSFLAISGSDGCIRVGGVVIAEARGLESRYRLGPPVRSVGSLPAVAARSPKAPPARGAGAAPGRVELDGRPPTPAGPVRAFLRVDGTLRAFERP
jgi:hypothetical protein